MILSIITVIYLNSNLVYKDVKPIFEDRCALCHNANWPEKNWLDYNKAKANASLIKMRLGNKTMPPDNITNITQEERDKVIKWIKEGAN